MCLRKPYVCRVILSQSFEQSPAQILLYLTKQLHIVQFESHIIQHCRYKGCTYKLLTWTSIPGTLAIVILPVLSNWLRVGRQIVHIAAVDAGKPVVTLLVWPTWPTDLRHRSWFLGCGQYVQNRLLNCNITHWLITQVALAIPMTECIFAVAQLVD